MEGTEHNPMCVHVSTSALTAAHPSGFSVRSRETKTMLIILITHVVRGLPTLGFNLCKLQFMRGSLFLS